MSALFDSSWISSKKVSKSDDRVLQNLELLPGMVEDFAEIKNALVSTTKKYNASAIPSEIRRRSFQCLNHNMPKKDALIYNKKSNSMDRVVESFVETMIDFQSKGKTAENANMSPAVKNLLETTSQLYMEHSPSITVENQRHVTFIRTNELYNREECTSITDHTLRIGSDGVRVMVIEDKSVGFAFPCPPSVQISQVMAAMMAELHFMEHIDQFIPEEFCGLLHNGQEFILVRTCYKGGSRMWHYHRSQPCYVLNQLSQKYELQILPCKEVSLLLQHALCVADVIASHYLSEIPLIPSFSALNITQHEHEERGNDGGGSGGSQQHRP